jgi:Transposase DDE domain group 1
VFPDWRYHAFLTDRPSRSPRSRPTSAATPRSSSRSATSRKAPGLNHAPSGRFFANAAWLLASCLAHNLVRWLARLGRELRGPLAAQTIRRRYLTPPGRITRSGRRSTLHLPARSPWRQQFTQALQRLRAIPLLT